jgi:ribonucleoside-diphosphate reductase alpha chain
MDNSLTEYFNGDKMAADSWASKYQMKDDNNIEMESTPDNMHWRLAKEFGEVEYSYRREEIEAKNIDHLSSFGRRLIERRKSQSKKDVVNEIYTYFEKFRKIVPQGSIMSNLGNPYVFGSLSNCFVIPAPYDSYSGLLKTDEELTQLMKRRGGVGTRLDSLRPTKAKVSNAAKTSTGVPSFMERYSNTTREVAQDGRRGALMLLLHCLHPDIFKFVTAKDDKTKVTGANVSSMLTDEFLRSVELDADFFCRFPIDSPIEKFNSLLEANQDLPYNEMKTLEGSQAPVYVMRIHAKELFDLIVEMAWKNAEPGVAYIDRIQDYAPDGVYPRFRPTKCNPCGEIWMGDYDACRLIAENFFYFIDNPFTENAAINVEKVYEVSYMQQRLGDNLIDLEVQYIQRIIDKVKKDPEPEEVKAREINLWTSIRNTTRDGRRTGNGFTALGDMLAALNVKYGSQDGRDAAEVVMKIKMMAELDASIDMAITRGAFKGHNKDVEFDIENGELVGKNSFYKMLMEEFPIQAERMFQNGRRNVSWSTVAPTGTVSLMTQTTSGLEPLFKAYYIRRKKINPNDTNVRIDFTDQNGDTWQEYAILHPKFKEWLILNFKSKGATDEGAKKLIDNSSKLELSYSFEQSPWYGSEANDISWEDRVKMNAIIQRYTSNALSCTINLPTDVPKSTVANIYLTGWKLGLKGVTVYRDGSRSGVLINEPTKKVDKFGYTDAPKRPKELNADYYFVTSKGKKYAVIVGLMNEVPYEVFVFESPTAEEHLKGKIVKVKRGVYKFISEKYTIDNLQLSQEHTDEKLLTRWISLLLRHGANPKFIAEQVEKSEVQITSFPKVIARMLKKYIPNEATNEECPECHQPTMIYEEGCKKCKNCGFSKC